MAAAITIVGLGPGQWHDLTLQARDALARALADRQTVYFRTLIHPTLEPLQATLPGLQITSFDHLYDEIDNWDGLYRQIAAELCALAARQPVIYAVPGHPLVGETSVQRVLVRARAEGLSTVIVAGLSFLEPVCSALELDPLELGAHIVDATALAALDGAEVAGQIIPTRPLLVAQVYNRRIAGAVKLALSDIYPDEWTVKLVRAAGGGGADDAQAVISLPLYALDRNTYANHLSTLYVPPVDELTALRLPETLRYISMRLRREPDGCPWDRKQTHQSLTRYVIEETYEVVEALEENDMEKLAEELGDLLLQVYLHAEIARQEGDFSIGDVFEHVNAKLIRRHPHVFGDASVSGAEQVLVNWEAIKLQERSAAGQDVEAESALDRVPQATPALIISQEYQKRAARTGFEFAQIDDIYAKLAEELQELREAGSAAEQREEIGDLLFVAAKIARWLHVDAEEALRHANRKFRRRFQAMEALISQEGRPAAEYSREEWRQLWRRAKADLPR